MANGQFFFGSVCVTDIIEAYQKGHSGFTRGQKNGKVYMNLNAWLNPEPDQFGNDMNLSIGSAKDKDKEDADKFGGKRVYVGNMKKSDKGGGDIPANQRNDLSLGDSAGNAGPAASGPAPQGGLPF